MLLTSLLIFSAALPFVSATSCGSGQFFYSGKSTCIPLNGKSSRDAGSNPHGITCPTSSGDWYWLTSQNHCAPSKPDFNSSPSCSIGYKWHSSGSACVKDTPTQSSNSCSSSEFWWSERECCLSSGNWPRTVPPQGSKCPGGNWSWSSKLGCCVPQGPQYSEPQCAGGWSWVSGVAQCRPRSDAAPPTPSGYISNYYKPNSYDKRETTRSGFVNYHRKRNFKSRSEKLCPHNLTACPISSAAGLMSDYECLDTINDLTSCGGCASTSEGTDCTVISGARNVGCVQSTCVVYTCAPGFRLGGDKKSCISI